jgi:hypothetical protein
MLVCCLPGDLRPKTSESYWFEGTSKPMLIPAFVVVGHLGHVQRQYNVWQLLQVIVVNDDANFQLMSD